jgi:hypothetical protein
MYRGSQRLLCVSVWHRWPMSRGGVHRCQPSRAVATLPILIGTVSGISGAPLGAEPMSRAVAVSAPLTNEPWHRLEPWRCASMPAEPMSRAVAPLGAVAVSVLAAKPWRCRHTITPLCYVPWLSEAPVRFGVAPLANEPWRYQWCTAWSRAVAVCIDASRTVSMSGSTDTIEVEQNHKS